MAYTQEMSVRHKALFVLLLDLSHSRTEPAYGSTWEQGVYLVDFVKFFLQSLCSRASWSEDIDWCDVAVMGYCADGVGNPLVESAFGGLLVEHQTVAIGELREYLRQVERLFDVNTEAVREAMVDVPMGVKSSSETGNPTCMALETAHRLVESWIAEHPHSFPPVVFNLTCGEPNVGDAVPFADALKRLETEDGSVLLLNCHLAFDKIKESCKFPTSVEVLGDDLGRRLFQLSSEFPTFWRQSDAKIIPWDKPSVNLEPGARLYINNADRVDMLDLLDLVNSLIDVQRQQGQSELSELSSTHSERSETHEEPATVLDENVQFTVYVPKTVKPNNWYPMLAFAHLDELPEGEDEPDPIQEVQRQAKQVLGKQIRQYKQATQDSSHAVPKEGEITFVPEVEGCEFNPPRQSFRWIENVHKAEFRVRADGALDGRTSRGRLSVFMGAILLSDVPLRIKVDSAHRDATEEEPTEPVSARPYRKIFASYSRKDVQIVEQFEVYAETLGGSLFAGL